MRVGWGYGSPMAQEQAIAVCSAPPGFRCYDLCGHSFGCNFILPFLSPLVGTRVSTLFPKHEMELEHLGNSGPTSSPADVMQVGRLQTQPGLQESHVLHGECSQAYRAFLWSLSPEAARSHSASLTFSSLFSCHAFLSVLPLHHQIRTLRSTLKPPGFHAPLT